MTHLRVDELIMGHSSAMRALRDAVRRAAPRNGPVLIEGPTGAGKELVAQGLHAESGRAGPFVPFNVAAIPEGLFESELLGHVRGAFSGAIRDRPGLLRRAARGTAFMDEVGELPLAAQAKLLRVLDTREVWPVGADSGERVDFRLVTATNADLTDAVASGRFRTDLLFRLRGILIPVPALWEHREDIPVLAAHFGRMVAAECGEADLVLSPGALRRLGAHSWPGNVRELRRVIEHAAFLAGGPFVSETHVLQALTPDTPGHGRSTHAGPGSAARCEMLALLDACGGDVTTVARLLGIDRSTAYRRIRRLGIVVHQTAPRQKSRREPGTTILAEPRDLDPAHAFARELARELVRDEAT